MRASTCKDSLGCTCVQGPQSLSLSLTHTHMRGISAHKRTHYKCPVVSRGEEAVARLCADLMSFNSLAPGPGVGQSWAEAKTGPDHLWRQEKPEAKCVRLSLSPSMCVCVCVCVHARARRGRPPHLSLPSSLIYSVSLSQYQRVCARSARRCVCAMLRRWKLQGTETAADWITPDKAIDRGIKVTIEYLQHTELIHSAALICSTSISRRRLAAHRSASRWKLAPARSLSQTRATHAREKLLTGADLKAIREGLGAELREKERKR